MVRVAVGLVLLGVVSAFAVSCSSTTTESSGGETNWLATCTTDADCKGVASCLCGLCTKGCTDDTTCIGVGSSVCVRSSSPSFAAICGVNTVVAKGICADPTLAEGGADAAAHAFDGSVARPEHLEDGGT